MAEVAIRAHTRRGKDGKTVQVHSYKRRVGRKGIHSPKREKQGVSGEEFEKKVAEKAETPTPVPRLTPEEIARRREVTEDLKRAEAERKSLGFTREQYSRYKLNHSKENGKAATPTRTETSGKSISAKKTMGILEKIEDKIATFVEKYSGKKYKRGL